MDISAWMIQTSVSTVSYYMQSQIMRNKSPLPASTVDEDVSSADTGMNHYFISLLLSISPWFSHRNYKLDLMLLASVV
jgi:hypothetical protein